MRTLNRAASEVLVAAGVRGATDVTGFGLLGHGLEMARASGTRFVFDAAALPALPGALELAAAGVETGGAAHNRRFVAAGARASAAASRRSSSSSPTTRRRPAACSPRSPRTGSPACGAPSTTPASSTGSSVGSRRSPDGSRAGRRAPVIVALIPGYNEAPRIGAVIGAAREHLPVIVVDDGSSDGTADVAREAGATVVEQRPEPGQGRRAPGRLPPGDRRRRDRDPDARRRRPARPARDPALPRGGSRPIRRRIS